MKRKLLLATLLIGATAEIVVARGFGGGLGHDHSPGFVRSWLSGPTEYDFPWFTDDSGSPPGLVNSSGTGFGNPVGISSAQAVNQEMATAPQVNPESQMNAFANEAAGLNIRMGGFAPGEFGPTRTGGNSAADLRVQGNSVRKAFKNYDVFGPNWYRTHPNAWRAGSGLAVWNGAAWNDINQSFGNDWDAFSYDYGTDLVYENNVVNVNGRPYATANKYFERAAELARIGEQAQVRSEPAAQWMPLGVFEAIPPGKKSSKMLMQLAVNKAGIVRGNYYDTDDQNVQRIEGAIDKDTARVVWVVSDRKGIMFDTSLFNLTRRDLAVLVHAGKDKNERWVLVRLQQPANAATSR